MSDEVKKAAEEVKDSANALSAKLDEMKKSFEDRLEANERELAKVNKSLVRGQEAERKIGSTYGFLDARKDVLEGRTQRVPLWDAKTQKAFNDWSKAKYQKDYAYIQKAFGDNVQDNLSNWTPDEFRAEIVRLAFLNSFFLQNGTIVPMSRDKMKMPAPSGNYTIAWVDEGEAMTDSKITAGYVELDTHKAGGLALINRENLQDPAVNVSLFIPQQMAEDFAVFIDTECSQGDAGVGSYVFDGVFGASTESVAGGTDATPTFAELLTEDNLIAMVGKLDDRELAGAQWFFPPAAFSAIRAIEDGAGSKIVRLNEGYMFDLLGYPINRSTVYASNTAAASGMAGWFGNPKHIYIGDRQDLQIDVSEHYRFANDQVLFRATQRLAIKVALPSSVCKIVFGAAA